MFHLRPFLHSDAPSLALHANNPAIADNLTNAFPHPYTLSDAEQFIARVSAQSPTQVFCIEVDGEAAGGIGLFPQADIMCKNAELGYWLSQDHWGKGIITAAIRQMVDYGFRTWDISRIFARPFGSNTASQRVLEKAGFILEARLEKTIFKNGREEDECIYAVRKTH